MRCFLFSFLGKSMQKLLREKCTKILSTWWETSSSKSFCKISNFHLRSFLRVKKPLSSNWAFSSEAKKSVITLNFHNIHYGKIEKWSKGQIALSSENFLVAAIDFCLYAWNNLKKKILTTSTFFSIVKRIFPNNNQEPERKGLMSFSK